VVDRMRSMEVQGIDLVVLSISRTPVMYRAKVSAEPDLRMAAGQLVDQLRGVGLEDESAEGGRRRNTMRLFKVCVPDTSDPATAGAIGG